MKPPTLFLAAFLFLLVAGSMATSPALADEVEPNDTSVTATPITLTAGAAKVTGNVFPVGDADYYSFTATAGDRVYAATMTARSFNGSIDSVLTLYNTDGTTVIESDNDNGTFGATSSSIAGATIPATGTYFLRVNHFSAVTRLYPYDLYVQVQSGLPTAETEANDSTGAPNPALSWASGGRGTGTDQDWYPIALAAGDTVFLSLDLDPERDGTTLNGRVGLNGFGSAGTTTHFSDDAGAAEVLPNAPSEAFFMTVKDAGTYHALVEAADASTGTYHLNITVIPKVVEPSTIHTSTNVPVAIPTGPGMVTSTLTIPGTPRIGKLRVHLDLDHNFMADLEITLVSPDGSEVGLLTDCGSSSVGANTQMRVVLDDEAAVPAASSGSHPYSLEMKGLVLQPDKDFQLDWFTGVAAGGVWTLNIRDDATGDGGTLNGWSLEIVEDEGPPAATTNHYSSDFESDDGGFTHSGTSDEWERGLPIAAPITTANSGVNCWKTDLDNTYNASSNQELVSPDIDLTAATGDLFLTWAQKFQIELPDFDHAYVEVQEVGGGGLTRKVWEWSGATMTTPVGSPLVTVQESAGWALMHADISDFLGMTVRVVFHLDGDTSVHLGGLAIDDVSVFEVSPAPTFIDDSITVLENEAPVDLAIATGPSPAGGVFTGMSGVNSMAGTFNPAGLALGPYTVTYTEGSTSADVTVTVIEAPSLTVTSTDDTLDELDGQTTLREALAYAVSLNGPQTVDFSNSTANGAVNFHDATADVIRLTSATEIVIDGTILIQGPGAELLTVSGDQGTRVFRLPGTVPTDEVTIRGLTIADGGATEGGAILVEDGGLTVEDCLLTGNSANLDGGAIHATGTSLDLIDCVFTMNQADQGGAISTGSDGSCLRCRFEGNRSAEDGGAAEIDGGTFVITDSLFTGNTADDEGGAIDNNGTSLTLVNCTISGNTADTAGGGINNQGGLALVNCTITGNRADADGVEQSPGTPDEGLGGGGIRTDDDRGVVTLSNTIVAGNRRGASGSDVAADLSTALPMIVGVAPASANNLIGDPGFVGELVHGVNGNTIGKANGAGPRIEWPIAEILGALADNGGPTFTHALLIGSPAVDTGSNALALDAAAAALTNDQRGLARIVKGKATSLAATVDIGAYELFAAPAFTNANPSVKAGGSPLNLAAATGATPPGGVFLGPGVSGGLFDPTGLAPGVYLITYTVQDAFGATNVGEILVTVEEPDDAGSLPVLQVQKPSRFAQTLVGSESRVRTLKITNVGGLPAKGIRLVATGRDFRVSDPLKRQLGVGEETSFDTIFAPKRPGLRKTKVTIFSDALPVTVRMSGRAKPTLLIILTPRVINR